MSIVSLLTNLFPKELVCSILQYDSRFSVKNGNIKEYKRLKKRQTRFVENMLRERTLHLAWFALDDWHDLRPKLVLPMNRHDKIVLCVFDAEYLIENTEETYFETARELYMIRGVKHMELLCEY